MKIMNTTNGTLKFGIRQLSKPTPKFATNFFRTVSFLAGLWALVQHLALGLSAEMIATINEWAVAALPIIHFTVKFFGWDYSEPSYGNFDLEKLSNEQNKPQ